MMSWSWSRRCHESAGQGGEDAGEVLYSCLGLRWGKGGVLVAEDDPHLSEGSAREARKGEGPGTLRFRALLFGEEYGT